MEIESVKCECCGLKEDCTQDYITQVKNKFDGKWLCGLCSEAVTDEVLLLIKSTSNYKITATPSPAPAPPPLAIGEAVKAHMSFCRKFKSNPATRVADAMLQMLRRRRSAAAATAVTAAATTSSIDSHVGLDHHHH
ncbi:uncharacterized protein LOC124928510 [Impatiens glandulifera]|uniref:uncharacterized protein LOC124928510 n=1 Tax=Impatiens glandulifera TaxID=253017 RepID=UPI001FB0608B|nr:uncharacterized protein LOC124928510 [Impatiens glandulifera]